MYNTKVGNHWYYTDDLELFLVRPELFSEKSKSKLGVDVRKEIERKPVLQHEAEMIRPIAELYIKSKIFSAHHETPQENSNEEERKIEMDKLSNELGLENIT